MLGSSRYRDGLLTLRAMVYMIYIIRIVMMTTTQKIERAIYYNVCMSVRDNIVCLTSLP